MKIKHPLMIVLALVGLCVGGCGESLFEDSLEIIKKKANAGDLEGSGLLYLNKEAT
jgi:hypothetical protein